MFGVRCMCDWILDAAKGPWLGIREDTGNNELIINQFID